MLYIRLIPIRGPSRLPVRCRGLSISCIDFVEARKPAQPLPRPPQRTLGLKRPPPSAKRPPLNGQRANSPSTLPIPPSSSPISPLQSPSPLSTPPISSSASTAARISPFPSQPRVSSPTPPLRPSSSLTSPAKSSTRPNLSESKWPYTKIDSSDPNVSIEERVIYARPYEGTFGNHPQAILLMLFAGGLVCITIFALPTKKDGRDDIRRVSSISSSSSHG